VNSLLGVLGNTLKASVLTLALLAKYGVCYSFILESVLEGYFEYYSADLSEKVILRYDGKCT